MSIKRVHRLANRLKAFGVDLKVYKGLHGSVTIGTTTFPTSSGAIRYLRGRLQQEEAAARKKGGKRENSKSRNRVDYR